MHKWIVLIPTFLRSMLQLVLLTLTSEKHALKNAQKQLQFWKILHTLHREQHIHFRVKNVYILIFSLIFGNYLPYSAYLLSVNVSCLISIPFNQGLVHSFYICCFWCKFNELVWSTCCELEINGYLFRSFPKLKTCSKRHNFQLTQPEAFGIES